MSLNYKLATNPCQRSYWRYILLKNQNRNISIDSQIEMSDAQIWLVYAGFGESIVNLFFAAETVGREKIIQVNISPLDNNLYLTTF